MTLGAVLAAGMIRGTTRSLRELAVQAALVAERRRDDLAFATRGDEIGELAEAFCRVLDASRRDRDSSRSPPPGSAPHHTWSIAHACDPSPSGSG